MLNPTARVLELLQTHRHLSGGDLANRLGVDRRTLRRYIRTLEEIGIPVNTERGCHGGYRLMPSFKLPPLMFTAEESQALALGLKSALHLGLSESAPAVESARAKLERVMPSELQQRVRALDESTRLALPTTHATNNKQLLGLLATATQERQRIRLDYLDSYDQTSKRVLNPYGLVYHSGHWYVSGWCHLRHDLRSFRLDRICEAIPLSATFDRPTDFDAAAHLIHSLASLPRATAVELWLDTDLESAAAELAPHIGLLTPTDSGVTLHGHTDSLSWFARQLTRLSFDFWIVEPASLRDELHRQATRLQRLAEADFRISTRKSGYPK
ncbi:helix-turn-helix transcriptional regulator [Vreelandella titanicae]|uniref:helix-turn-helix transcriptional regulator n=1 Tax=Vreelandella titanicae TaxID=664683 RepID=UPI000587CA45|nr:YafY family protein [Halomonas titanicae]NVE91365.1 YafY family transcriptional regulator [Halomonas titanicae]|tara:strand:- start:361 stop:1341 length:981 start_codon:yes stop_codon:yes gene_type:complete